MILVFLLILILLFSTDPIGDRFLVQPVWRIASDQPDQQGNNILEQCLALIQLNFGKRFLDKNQIQAPGAFQARTTRDVEKLAPICRGESSVALGNIQYNGSSRTVKLVVDSGGFGEALQNGFRPFSERERFFVRLKFFVVEIDFHNGDRIKIKNERLQPKSSSYSQS